MLKSHIILWKHLLPRIAERLCDTTSNETNVQRSENIIQSLLHIVKSKHLLNDIASAKKFLGKDLMKLSCVVEKHLQNGPIDRLAGKLKTEVELILGVTKAIIAC